jgi:hypothetical protein
MATLPTGGAGRTATLGTGSSRSRSVAVGRPGRGNTIPTPIQETIGFSEGRATVEAVSDFDIVGNTILQEDGDQILQETGEFLLLEDGASTGFVECVPTVRGTGAALADAFGTSAGIGSASGVMEEPAAAGDTLLQEIGDDLLQESGDFILLETGAVPPGGRLLDVTSLNALVSVTGDYLIGV